MNHLSPNGSKMKYRVIRSFYRNDGNGDFCREGSSIELPPKEVQILSVRGFIQSVEDDVPPVTEDITTTDDEDDTKRFIKRGKRYNV